jgi:hypothetical protein
MPARPRDTSPEAFEVQLRLVRAITPEQKLRQVGELFEAARQIALAGLRERYPNDTPDTQRLRLAALLLGDSLVTKVYGWEPEKEGR